MIHGGETLWLRPAVFNFPVRNSFKRLQGSLLPAKGPQIVHRACGSLTTRMTSTVTLFDPSLITAASYERPCL